MSVGELVVGGGAAAASGLPGPSDGAGDRGDPAALPDQEAAHPRRHRGQEAAAAELLRRNFVSLVECQADILKSV